MAEKKEIYAHLGLRGIAAVSVLFSHAIGYYRFLGNPLLPAFPFTEIFQQFGSWAIEAVALFFVLSGFIFAYLYGGRQVNWREFFASRFARIYPLYAVTGIVAFCLPATNGPLLADGPPCSYPISDVLINALMLQDWKLHMPWPSMNPPAWSLSVEFFFYLILFPALLVASRSRMRNVFLVAAILITAYSGPAPNFWRFARWPALFTTGFAICDWVKSNGVRDWKGLLGLGTAAVAVFAIFQESFRWMLIPAFVPLVYFTSDNSHPLARFLSLRPFVFLGTISYSLYLWHMPVLIGTTLFRHTFFPVRAPASTDPARIFYDILTVVVVFLVSTLSYYLFEDPMRKWLRAKLGSARRDFEERVSDDSKIRESVEVSDRNAVVSVRHDHRLRSS
jgi:peptidoglycan/LPS O-acetylase OafA/YrhL